MSLNLSSTRAAGFATRLAFVSLLSSHATAQPVQPANGWKTNGPAVFRSSPPANGNQPASAPNSTFDHFLPNSLHQRIWTNLTARTNGRTTAIWAVRTHPPSWPKDPPVVRWDTNCVIWGFKGLTGLSPCWEGEGSSGQAPITLLTKRHGYTRGHGMGPDGFARNRRGKEVWFVTTNNTLVTARISREVIRTRQSGGADYTIVLFERDVPATIEPLKVVEIKDVHARYPGPPGAPRPVVQPEQGGHVSLQLPGFTVNTWKQGDSGSADLVPLDGELIFVNGRSTSGPTPEMQKDMDELCRLEGINPAKYQLRWADLSAFPNFQ